MKLGIARGESRLSPTIRNGNVAWEQLRDKLLKVVRTKETYAHYLKMSRDEQTRIKDVGYFIGGRFKSNRRKLSDLVSRSVITLDIDHLPCYDLDLIEETYRAFEYVLHSTHKHGEDSMRLRLVFPLLRAVTPQEYEPLARMIASLMGMGYFDDTTYQPARIMFWGSASTDGAVIAVHNQGLFVDPDQVLQKYSDYQSHRSWPTSSREGPIRERIVESSDPLTAPGVVGAFNRSYDVHSAIHEFELPYESTGSDNRYRLHGSSGASGAVVYDEVFLYSHHESDPAGQKNNNAFDLVRLHRFGDWTPAELSEEVPVSQRESFKQMTLLAMQSKQVLYELAHDDFDDFEDQGKANGEDKSTDRLRLKEADLTFIEIRQEIEALNPPTQKALDALIVRVAAARLPPVDTDVLAGVLRNHWIDPAPAKSSIMEQIKSQVKRLTGKTAGPDGTIADIERSIIRTVLRQHFTEYKTK